MSDSAPTPHVVHVAVHTPMHSTVGGPLSYTHPSPLPPGTLVRVRLGTRPLLGVVWEAPQDAEPVPAHVQLRALDAVLPLPPLDATWLRLVAFAARYYQRS
ncbi:primosomal protein N', partial [Comamonas aquatica]|nr:primosomal protein N' [Comamonas aquatica]